ncbi:MAG: hypothetical protein PQJ47_06390 [Sphaerochaetaceae bacterium]|nr:hypothetical protein [Sphaerochaetaceae bacterium]
MNRRLLTIPISTVMFVVCLISCHSITGFSQFVTSEDTTRYLSTSVETEKDHYQIGEPVELIFTVTNLSADRFVTFLSWEGSHGRDVHE